MRNVLTLLLAGGQGSRLAPLSAERAKPAVPFGGQYRIIDLALSNCINSGLRRILVMTQYKAASLDRHLKMGWNFLCRELGEFVDVLPPQQRVGEHWYQGTADAVYQNIYTIEQSDAEYLLVLSGDHIYKMDYERLINDHILSSADCTIACMKVPIDEGKRFGVLRVTEDKWIDRFEEKPENPFPVPGDSEHALASMGIYVFNTKFLFEELCRDAALPASAHDFGKNLIPAMIGRDRVRAYPFEDRNTGNSQYWRDVGTIDSYYDANMDLVSVHPLLDLYDPTWPIRGTHPTLPPPKFVFADEESDPPRVGRAIDSLVCSGCILSGGEAVNSILSPGVRINSWASVRESLLFDGVEIGRHSKVQKAIIDKGVRVPPNIQIGFDTARDITRGFTVSPNGVTVVPKDFDFETLQQP